MKDIIIKLFSLEPSDIENFEIIPYRRRISNGPIESANSRIKLIKRNANGYKNFDRFRLRCLYTLNKGSTIKL